MNRLLSSCAAVGLIAALPMPSYCLEATTEQAKQWLERMVQTTQHLNYEGTFVYVQGPHIEVMRLIHGYSPDGEKQRLLSLTGSPREIVVSKEGVVALQPGQTGTLGSNGYQYTGFPISIPREIGRLEGQYSFTLEEQDRVAGLEAQVVAIKPRDALRYGYRLWLDQRNGMLLRSAVMDDKDAVVEQVMFTDLQIKPQLDDSLFRPPTSAALAAAAPVSPAPAPDNAKPPTGTPISRSAWRVAQLPVGFEKILHNRFAESSGRHPTEHMVFADGLATISVFLERLDGGAAILQGQSQLGSMNAFGIKVDDYQILVVGEVPITTVQNIATSISYDAGLAKELAQEAKP